MHLLAPHNLSEELVNLILSCLDGVSQPVSFIVKHIFECANAYVGTLRDNTRSCFQIPVTGRVASPGGLYGNSPPTLGIKSAVIDSALLVLFGSAERADAVPLGPALEAADTGCMEGMPTAKERLLLRSEGAAADSADANSAPARVRLLVHVGPFTGSERVRLRVQSQRQVLCS